MKKKLIFLVSLICLLALCQFFTSCQTDADDDGIPAVLVGRWANRGVVVFIINEDGTGIWGTPGGVTQRVTWQATSTRLTKIREGGASGSVAWNIDENGRLHFSNEEGTLGRALIGIMDHTLNAGFERVIVVN